MEIKEIINHYVNFTNDILEVSFRTIDDDDTELRNAEIPVVEIIAFGYDFIKNDSSLLEMFEDEEDDGDDEFLDGIPSNKNESLDVYDLMSFLNEYYLVYPDQLPKKELF